MVDRSQESSQHRGVSDAHLLLDVNGSFFISGMPDSDGERASSSVMLPNGVLFEMIDRIVLSIV